MGGIVSEMKWVGCTNGSEMEPESKPVVSCPVEAPEDSD